MDQNKMKKYSAVDVNNNDKNNNKWKSYPKQITHNTTNNLLYSTPSNFILTQHHRGTKNAQVNQPPRQTLLRLSPLILVITGYFLY